MQATWQIISSAGVDLGTFAGATAAEALDALARDAGYASRADVTEQIGAFDGFVRPADDVDRWLPDYAAHGYSREQAQRIATRASEIMAAERIAADEWTTALDRAIGEAQP